MVSAPLCIIQARLGSTRLPNKMLTLVAGHPVLWYGWHTACDLYGPESVVIACPEPDFDPIHRAISQAQVFGYTGDENDVLGRFHACAHKYRSHPLTTIIRVTPDDFPIDPLREQCTLQDLDHWHHTVTDPRTREHIGYLFPPRLELNEPQDLEALRARLESR